LAIADRGIDVVAHCEQVPLFYSNIKLDYNVKDKFGDPIAKISWKIDEETQINSIRQFALSVHKYVKEKYHAEIEIVNSIVDRNESALDLARDSYHQCGGACMGSNESVAVVDSNCKVFGTNNLYIAGAAVFPSSSFANPTYTALALAERLASALIHQGD
jgi:choline dehydrogenase-like flavoprotein